MPLIRIMLTVVLAIGFLVGSSFAQSSPNPPFLATPKVLKLFEETKDSLDDLAAIDTKAAALFQLLTMETKLTDKTAAAETIDRLTKLLPEIKSEKVRFQLLEGIAHARAEMGDFEAAVETLAKIDDDTVRARAELALAETILYDIEDKKTSGDKDLSSLLLKAAATASLEGLVDAEALAMTLLGKEFGRQGKAAQAKVAFENARKLAVQLEDNDRHSLQCLIVRSQTLAGLLADADATVQTITEDGEKQIMNLLIVSALAEKMNFDEAEKRAKSFSDKNAKDNALLVIARNAAKNNDTTRVLALSVLLESDEIRAAYFDRILTELVNQKSFETALKIADGGKVSAEMAANLRLMAIEALMDDDKHDEAKMAIEKLDDDQLRRTVTRHLLLRQLRQGLVSVEQIDAQAGFSQVEKEEIEKRRKEFETADASEKPLDDKLTLFFQIFEKQMQLFDLLGGKKTLDAMQTLSETEINPAKLIANRLILAQIQRDMGQKDQAAKNLVGVKTIIDDTENPMTLKDLVLENATEASPQVAATITESMVRDQMLSALLSTADALVQMGKWDEARSALQKVHDLNIEETNPMKKSETLLFLARKTAELETLAATK